MPVSETRSVERETQGWVSLLLQVEQGEQRNSSCERLDRDVQAGLPAKQGLRSAEGGALQARRATGPSVTQ